MTLIGTENLADKLSAEPSCQHKALINEAGIVVFPVSTQHSTIKAPGLSYEDDSMGNALAVIFDGRKFEIRGHRGFTAERVQSLLDELVKHPKLAAIKGLLVTYQGKPISR